jgi:hypothetical protein
MTRIILTVNCVFRVPVGEDRSVLCEIQLHLKSVLAAKNSAHLHYEIVRVELPKVCFLFSSFLK